jgi:hypothetical protein
MVVVSGWVAPQMGMILNGEWEDNGEKRIFGLFLGCS